MKDNEKIIIKGMDSVSDIAKETIKDSPWPVKVLVFGQVGAILLAVIMSVLVFIGNPKFGLPLIIIALAPTFFVIYKVCQLLKDKELTSIWNRAYVDNQFNDDRFEKIGDMLEKIRKQTYKILMDLHSENISLNFIRANIFLPDIYNAKEGFSYDLFMPNSLQRNMEHQGEFGIRFKAGQGATGRSFLNGEIKYTFARDFAIDDEHKHAVHKDLKWILSIPIKEKKKGYTLAVINIDGLTVEISEEDMVKIEKGVKDQVNFIENEFNKLQMKTLFITHI